MELVVFVASLKFFFVEDGEQSIVGIQIAKKIGIKETIRITIAGISFAIILVFLLFYSYVLVSTRWLELALGITLYFFAPTLQPANFGRVYAAYGGVFIFSSIIWGALIDRKRPDKYEIVGSLIVILGAAIIFYSPR